MTQETTHRAAALHLARIAAVQQELRAIEQSTGELVAQLNAKKKEYGATTKRLRDLVDQAAGIQALPLPFENQP